LIFRKKEIVMDYFLTQKVELVHKNIGLTIPIFHHMECWSCFIVVFHLEYQLFADCKAKSCPTFSSMIDIGLHMLLVQQW
jgi:hypothetical protein